MAAENQRILDLIAKFEKGTANSAEMNELDHWYGSFDSASKYTPGLDNDRRALLRDKILEEINTGITRNPKTGRSTTLWSRLAWSGAAAALLLSFGLYFYNSSLGTAVDNMLGSQKVDAAPGGDRATLTLADGRVVVLDSLSAGNIARQGNTQILKLDKGTLTYRPGEAAGVPEMNTLRTPAGGQFTVQLPDSSKVWLNASSSITFPTAFTGSERKVIITGEAYFEVSKNAEMPFRVVSTGQEIEVLGTHFNVNAYEDELHVNTTLLEGSVRISNKLNGSKTILKPGQQASVAGEDIRIAQVDPDKAVAWKNGLFFFDHTDLKSLMRQLARWYNLEIVYEGTVNEDKFFGKIERSYTLSEVLKVLELGKVHVRMEAPKDPAGKKKLVITP